VGTLTVVTESIAMARHHALYDWVDQVVTAFHPHLSRPQATVLAFYSFGIVLAQRCGLNSVVMALIPILGGTFLTLRSRLQEFYQPAPAKSGSRRRELDVTTCFAPLLDWVLTGWTSTRLALALDATALGDRLTVLSISVVYRGCALPVAWKVLRGNVKHPWEPEWLKLLDELRDRLPAGWTVIVLTDRGLYARWLFEAIVKRGWHPLMRVTATGKFREAGSSSARPLTALVPEPGRSWQGRGTAFPRKPERRLDCTLLACWEPGQEEAWFVLTDLGPEASEALWYGLRAWIEHGFKLLKSDGWQWQRTQMTDPERVERLWLALAVATRYVLALGGEVEDGKVVVETIPELPPIAARSPTTSRRRPRPAPRRHPEERGGAAEPSPRRPVPEPKGSGDASVDDRLSGTEHRMISIFRQGLAVLVGLMVAGQKLPAPQWSPEPWLELRHHSSIPPRQPPPHIPINPSL
jgi:Transposase DDE domain